MNLAANRLILEDVEKLLIRAMMLEEDDDIDYAIGIMAEAIDEALRKIQRVLEDYNEV